MGAWEEIVDYTVPSNTTSVTLNNFGTITKDDFIKVVVNHNNTTSELRNLRLLANSSNNSDYHRQTLLASSAAVNAERSNDNLLLGTGSNDTSTTISYIKLSENDRFNIFSQNGFRDSSTLQVRFHYTTSSGATFTSGITSLTLEAATANAIGTNSRIQIYKLAAEKVADITVESNTTQVDISNLSIDKDSEYLLISDVLPRSGGLVLLGVNGNTTSSDYHRQRIRGDGSNTLADRQNRPEINIDDGTNRLLNYTHIKLSNIGAYTAQSYGIRRVGTITILLQNYFISSTAENITSITQLNITSSNTSGIATGSRFTLYKLYEGGN